ncbi:cadherin-like domain-containing protein [Sphingomonas sp. SUN039]|uniref:cadherin-like domain-containing protein n=1 Tax=Sphingomonas sp. SUN039 TaxID=2937787 RepID=UPI00216422F6|nr:cadherin-like domain-containing protein [Sphingomonas sp. SUN039]UVO55776.1 pre-peptidase C-terminal domain-containing protein [Sphingomonas sp. SUN039]
MADDFAATTATTGAVTVGGSATGTIEVGADRDWFRITLVAGQSYIFNLDRGTLLDPFLVLYDQNGVDIVGNDDIVTNVNFNSQIRFTATVSGTYYLAAFSSDGTDIGTYTVRAAIDPSPPASTDDYGAQAGSPNVGAVAVGGSTNGNLETLNDRDWFAITLTAGTSYTFRQEGITLADPFLRLRDGNGILISGNDDFGGTLNSQITYTAVTTGVYYLEGNTADAGNAAGIGTYRVTAAVNGNPPPPPTDDYGSQVGAGNLGSVVVGSSSTGLINYGGDHDWFAVALSAGSIYRIRQEIGTLPDPRFTLRNSIGITLTGDDDSGGGQNAQVDYTAPTSGTYYIDANSADGTGPNSTGTYTVRLTLLYGAPVIVANTGSTAAEGAADTITSSELSTTDSDSAASAIVYTLTSLATNGTLTRNGTTLALNGTFTQADINSNLVVYTHNGSETTSASFGFSVTDGTTNFTGRTFNFTVTPVNDAPTSTGLAGDSVTATEPAGLGSTMPNVNIDAGGNMTFADVDNANFNGGTLRVAITAGKQAVEDQLLINTTGTVTIAGNVVSVGGTAIGTRSGGGAGGGDLVIALTANATPALLQSVVRAVYYANTGNDNPTAGVRTITTTLTDGSGTANGGADTVTITSTVTVAATDDTPVAVADSYSVNENVVLNVAPNVGVLANDTDIDGGPKTVATINGSAVNVGTLVTLASGARVTLNANGSLSYDPNGQFNYLVSAATAAATGAVNSSATDSFTYTANGGSSATVTITVNGVDGAGSELRGDGGNNTTNGTALDDYFNLSQGGNDTATGGNGNDAFFFGAAFTALDIVDGGPGINDQVGLQGNYSAGLTLGAGSLVNIEALAVLPGFSYSITSIDANVAAGQTLSVFGGSLAVGQNFTFNGSAETDGQFRMYGGLGNDNFTGGALDDGFYFGPGKWDNVNDTVVGGGGANDQLALDGNYTVSVGANADVETLALLAGPVGTPNTFNITLLDAWTAAAANKTVWGAQVTTAMTIDGSADTNGNLTFFGGSASDTLTGGGGADTISGGGGGDALRGNGGADIFRYDSVTDSNGSTNATRDRILDFTSGSDKIDLSRIDAINGGADDAFTFIGGGAFTNVAGQLHYIDNGNGTMTVEGDVDGNGVADFAILVTTAAPPVATDFIL